MIRQLGVLLVMAACACVTSASPSCVCTREVKPVCGSNGQTYDNMCMLRCQQQMNPSLQFESDGRCRFYRKQQSNACICTLELDPVCGSNGHTYPNPCALDCDPENHGTVQLLHHGECRAKREIGDFCICPYNYLPVCGTDGKTYGNECSLKCNRNVEVAHRGACREKREIAAERLCVCPFNYSPVCGTDGQTYGNECALNCKDHVAVAHRGVCRQQPEVEYEPSTCFCTLEIDPVCGTNGRTYDNMCALECEGSNVQFAYKGECKPESVKIADLPPCVCTREAKPVCGTDGKTYANPCLLNCLREQNEDLHILHSGRCSDEVKDHDLRPQPACTCARNLKPVCASDGKTYSNECMMECAGEDLTVEGYGPCDHDE